MFVAACLGSIGCVGLAAGLQFAGCGRSSEGLALDPALVVSVTPADPKIETGGVQFAEVAQERGLLHVWPQQPRPMRSPEAFGCGCATLDYDNDGWQDVLLVADPHARLYHNQGGGRFEDVTATSGLMRTEADWIGAAVGDFDGDGWLDLLLTGFHRLALFKNEQGKTFVDVTSQAGLDPANHEHWGSSAGFMDLDGDAHLDLVILNYVVFGPDSKQYCELSPGVRSGCPPKEYPPEKGEIWRNTGGGGFELVPESAGMRDTSGVALILAFTDVDDDGKQDFYIGNDGTRAEFMLNLGGMQFKNIGVEIGLAVGKGWTPMAAMGTDWADFDRDGLLDLTVTDFQNNCFALFRHDVYVKGDGQSSHAFTEVGNTTGISLATCNRLGFGAKWLDMDNDGWPDICYVNGHVYDNAGDLKEGESLRQATMLFRNESGNRFVDLVPVLDSALAKPIVGRGSATADFDNDGRVDLLIVDYEGSPLLFENRSLTENHWIKFDPRGIDANTFAYGARITARAADQIWVGQVSPTSSYLSSSDPRIHFGLGQRTSLETVTIRWPSGRVEELRDVSADQIARVVEGRGIVAAP
ncbi:MAG TPA: CRTAC1 family protein [Pirellulales bacterium]|nr:CRTAC1 family protein [Pirellulales bacterium]